MDWPGDLSNPNLIEKLWAVIKKKLKDDHTITLLPSYKKPS
jgi:hypothetical protein